MADETANGMSDIEKVKTWAVAKKLSEATTATVISLGFDSMKAVSLISPEDLAKSKIPVDQIKMLMKAVKQTFLSEDATAEDASHSVHVRPNHDDATGTSGNTVNNSINTAGDAYVDEVLCQLQQHGQPIGTAANSGRSTGLLGENFSWQELEYIYKIFSKYSR